MTGFSETVIMARKLDSPLLGFDRCAQNIERNENCKANAVVSYSSGSPKQII